MPPKQKQPSEGEAITIIAGALAVGASAQTTANTLAPLIGVPVPSLLPILLIATSRPIPHFRVPTLPSATASAENAKMEATYRAHYVYAALQRVHGLVGPDLQAALAREQTYFNQHIEATRNRRKASAAVDQAASRYGDELGWYAKMDSITSAECRAANGKNFSASRMPAIGYPGMVHPNCRCHAGRKHATSQTVYAVKPRKEAA